MAGRNSIPKIILVILVIIFNQTHALVDDPCSVDGDCDANEVCNLGSGSCTCDAGYHDTDGDDTCNACAEGTFKSATGTTACGNAQDGYYASISNAAVTSAATGETQVAEGNYACRSNDDGSGTNGVTRCC